MQQKKSKPVASRPIDDDVDESPAKRRRSIPSSPVASPLLSQVANRSNHNNNNNDIAPAKTDYASPVPRATAARAVINRPDIFTKPELKELDVSTVTETLKSKNITASKLKFGFIGLGNMGSGIVKNLINSGHDVSVYNRTHDKTKKFEKEGAKVMLTPSDVVECADITFSCVSDPEALSNVSYTSVDLHCLDKLSHFRPSLGRTESAVCRRNSHKEKPTSK